LQVFNCHLLTYFVGRDLRNVAVGENRSLWLNEMLGGQLKDDFLTPNSFLGLFVNRLTGFGITVDTAGKGAHVPRDSPSLRDWEKPADSREGRGSAGKAGTHGERGSTAIQALNFERLFICEGTGTTRDLCGVHGRRRSETRGAGRRVTKWWLGRPESWTAPAGA
jgi:hypothetical protein